MKKEEVKAKVKKIKKEHKENKTLKYLRNLAIFLILIWLTFKVLLQDQNMGELFDVIKSAKIPFLLLGMLCMVIYFSCESLNLRRTVVTLGEKCSFLRAIKYTLIGFFFSSITPAATGGQPMQIYYMHRDGIKVAHSTLALVLNLFSFQIVTIGMALISLFFFGSYMDGGIILLFIVGVTLNSMALALLAIGIFSKRLSTGLVNLTARIMKKFKVKNYEEKEKSMMEALEKYNGSAKYIRTNRKLVFRQFCVAIVQQVAYYSVPFCVLYALGLPPRFWLEIVALQSIVYATVSGIPSPGAVGVSEGAFISIFKTVFTESKINAAMLLHRGIGFYLPVAICSVIVLINTFRAKREDKELVESGEPKLSD